MPKNDVEQEQREFTYEEYLIEFCPDEFDDGSEIAGVAEGDDQSEQIGHQMAEDTIRTLMQAFDGH